MPGAYCLLPSLPKGAADRESELLDLRERVKDLLSPRQYRILSWIINGLSEEAISQRLSLTTRSVERDVVGIRAALLAADTEKRIEAAQGLLREGISVECDNSSRFKPDRTARGIGAPTNWPVHLIKEA